MRRFSAAVLCAAFFLLSALPVYATEDRRVSQADRLLLVRLVAAEAGEEPLLCQVCLAALVLNRRDSDRFPDTVAGVIRQEGAFSSVLDNRLFAETEEERLRMAAVAVAAAAYGMDPAGGSLYFAVGEAAFVPTLRAGNMVFGR